MEQLQTLLKKYIESRGFTIYSIAYRSGINRTTLQKILSGQRKMTKDIYDMLLPFLSLSPIEEEELNQAFLINQIGHDRYMSHMIIKDILEGDYDNRTLSTPPDAFFSYLSLNTNDLPDYMLINDSFQLSNMFYALIQNSMQHDEPYMYLFTGCSNLYISTLLKQFFYMDYERLKLVQLAEFAITSDFTNKYNNIYNLETIKALIPFLTSFNGHFSMYSYYTTDTKCQMNATVFPYYIITNDYIMLLSSDYSSGLLLSDKNIHDYYLNMYMKYLSKSSLIVNGKSSVSDLLESLIQDDNVRSLYNKCLNVQPIFYIYVTEAIFDKYMSSNPNYEHIKNLFYSRIGQLKELNSSHQIYFTKNGLDLFAETGLLVDIPANVTDYNDRILLLQAIIEANNNENHPSCVCINEKKLQISSHISLELVPPLFTKLMINFQYKPAAYIPICEQSLCSSFIDFINTFTEYGYLYSIEETNSIIQSHIDKLRALCNE